jgi:hypothetical protein
MYLAFSRISADSFTRGMSVARTALLISSSAMRIGTRIFRTTAVLWAALFSSTGILLPSSA